MQTGNKYAPVAVLLGGLFVVAAYLRWNAVAFEPVAHSLTFAFQLMLAGTVIAVLRNEIGMSTFGVFGPAILAFSWLEIGPFWGLLLISYVFVVAATARVAVSGFDLGTAHRLATLLVVACIAVFVMDSVGRLQGIPPLRTALLFPVVLTVWYAERFVGSLEATGWAPATRRLSVTLFAIAAAFAVAAYDPLVSFVIGTPESWIGLVALNVALGVRTDTRLGERFRFRRLRREDGGAGVLSMRVRNRDFVSRYNPRELLLSLDKARLKQTLHGLGVPTPETFLLVEDEGDFDDLRALVTERDAFVVKPVDRSGGEDVLVVSGRTADGTAFLTNRGELSADEVVGHTRDVVAGGLGDYGARSGAIVEGLVSPAGPLSGVAGGVPDVRVVTLLGYPVMAMARFPTAESRGTANLHGGAVGVGIDLATGEASGGYQQSHDRYLSEHPDTGESLSFAVPGWDDVLEIASRAAMASGLGYAGVDVVFDAARGPLVLEVNRRPGLGIQNVTGDGLLRRLHFVEAHRDDARFGTAAERVARARAWAADDWHGSTAPDATTPEMEVRA